MRIHCEGEKESRESTQKAFYAKYVHIMVHLSQSVKLFLNFHDLYFYTFKNNHFFCPVLSIFVYTFSLT